MFPSTAADRNVPRRIRRRSVLLTSAAGALLAVAAGCSSSEGLDVTGSSGKPLATPRETVLADTFADDSNGWGEFDVQEGHNYYDHGKYITDFRQAPFLHWLPEALAEPWDRGEIKLPDVIITARLAITRGEGVAGVFCRESEDSDAEYTWYEFVVRDGYAAIREADMRGNLQVLAETDDFALTPGAPFTLAATCVGDRPADLSLTVDGRELLRVRDEDQPLSDGLVGIQIWEAPDSAGAAPSRVEWASFSVATP